MPTIKKYQLLQGFQLTQFFEVNGKAVPITFSHGIRKPYLIRGMFYTDVPELQAVLEADNGFGTIFHEVIPEVIEDVIEGPTAEEIPKEEVPIEETKEEIPAEDPIKEEVPEETEPAITDYPDVKNLQEARQKMFDLFPGEFKPANLPNKPAVLNKAKAKNITFSKLK